MQVGERVRSCERLPGRMVTIRRRRLVDSYQWDADPRQGQWWSREGECGKSSDEAILVPKGGIEVEGDWGSLDYVSWHCCPACCGWVWEQEEAETHDHKGPTRTQTLAPSRYMKRGVRNVLLRRNPPFGVRRELVPFSLSARAGTWWGRPEAAIRASLLRHSLGAGVSELACRKILLARCGRNMALSWHHPGHL